jgi:hypothetical protein
MSSTSRSIAAPASSSRDVWPVMPALCTKCVSGPSCAAVCSKTRSMSASIAMSPGSATALPPADLTAPTTRAAALALFL